MKTRPSKTAYEQARRKALQQLAREYPKRYQKLVEQNLGRSLKDSGRPLPERVKRGEQAWGEGRR